MTGAFEVDGHYSCYLPGPGGHPVPVRKEDGTHLTRAGARLFARTALVDGRGTPFGD